MLWLLLFTPLIGSALCGALHFAALRAGGAGHAHGEHGHADAHGGGPKALAGLVACAAMAVALGLSAWCWLTLFREHDTLALESSVWHWIDAGNFTIELSLVVDRLSSVMLLVITGVGFLIH